MERVEKIILQAISYLLLAALVVATALLYVIFITRLWPGVRDFAKVADLQHGMHQTFAGVLAILIGLELLETLRAYSRSHNVRLQVVFAVAGIAVARHVIQMDFETIDGPMLIGLGVLVAALGIGYHFARRIQPPSDS